MIYIAESGSTKCDAVFLNEDGTEVTRISTMGFNPYFHNAEFIDTELKKVDEIQRLGKEVSRVFFFGAGCSSPGLNQKVVDGLRGSFPNAAIQVDHDLMACAYATYTGKPAISCILGTGSNTVYFDGTHIKTGVSGLGYILGDEGSASYIGKKIITAYLYGLMPEEAQVDFTKTYGLTLDDIRDRVYFKPNANLFLAGFAPFAQKHIRHPFFYDLVYEGFNTFITTQVMRFAEATTVPVGFVGSVAFYFRNILADVLKEHGLQMGEIVRKPLDGLIHYCLENILHIPQQEGSRAER